MILGCFQCFVSLCFYFRFARENNSSSTLTDLYSNCSTSFKALRPAWTGCSTTILTFNFSHWTHFMCTYNLTFQFTHLIDSLLWHYKCFWSYFIKNVLKMAISSFWGLEQQRFAQNGWIRICFWRIWIGFERANFYCDEKTCVSYGL